jgi:hypothetical protein
MVYGMPPYAFSEELRQRSLYSDYVIRWETGDSWFDYWRYQATYLLLKAPRSSLGPTQPHIQWAPGTLFQGMKRTGREADHSSVSSFEVKNEWSYISTPPHAFMACTGAT